MLLAEHVGKLFHPGGHNERLALADVSLSLAPGEFAVLVGSNGAGKSTLLNIIAGDFTPDRGRILIDSVDITHLPAYQRSRFIGRVFQDWAHGTAPDLTIEENLALAQKRGRRRTLAPALSMSRRQEFKDSLAKIGLGLENRIDTHAGLLSAGQRQALAVLMAVASTPRILLLDEHCAALDPVTAEIVMQWTERLILDSGITALMVTHNMRHAIQYGSRLILMRNGRIEFQIDDQEKSGLSVDALTERFKDIEEVI